MPRRPRVLIDGGYYHVFTRGNDKKKIFRHKDDYEFFLKTAIKYLGKFRIHIFHYCLMPNHIHLLLTTDKASDLPKFMQALLQVYADRFKKKYKATGFVFQNRYKSNLIEKESYLIECARYIERNPIRAGLEEELGEYEWSSFCYYAKGNEDQIIRKMDPLYFNLGISEKERRLKYRDFVSQDRPYEHIVDEVLRI